MPRSPPNLLPLIKPLTNQHPTRYLSTTSSHNHSLPTSRPAPTPAPSQKPHPPPLFPSTSPSPAPPLPITPLCPPPTCACAFTPTDLDIDRDGALSGTVPAYTQHVLISTGREDWASRITDDDDAHAALTGVLKRELGLGGKFHDPYRPVLITHSSFPPSPSALSGPRRNPAFLFPDFRYVPDIGPDPEAFIRTFLRSRASRAHEAPDEGGTLSPSALEKFSRYVKDTDPHDSHSHIYSRPVHELIVLICGHASRDRRCGVMGPLLRAQFITVLKAYGFSVDIADENQNQSPSPFPSPPPPSTLSSEPPVLGAKIARVGLTSHIGGHRFAGNVIVYVPPGFEFEESREAKEEEAMGDGPSAGRSSATATLQGMGIWYGRVEPRHVEGIVKETVRGGRVVGELLRGVVFGGDG